MYELIFYAAPLYAGFVSFRVTRGTDLRWNRLRAPAHADPRAFKNLLPQ